MNPAEKEECKRILKDFEKLKKKKLKIEDEEKLIDLMTGLIGIYKIDKEEKIKKMIEEMIRIAEKQKWGIQGTIIEFEKIK